MRTVQETLGARSRTSSIKPDHRLGRRRVPRLIYLALQVRGSKRARSAIIRLGRADRTSAAAEALADPDLARIWRKGVARRRRPDPRRVCPVDDAGPYRSIPPAARFVSCNTRPGSWINGPSTVTLPEQHSARRRPGCRPGLEGVSRTIRFRLPQIRRLLGGADARHGRPSDLYTTWRELVLSEMSRPAAAGLIHASFPESPPHCADVFRFQRGRCVPRCRGHRRRRRTRKPRCCCRRSRRSASRAARRFRWYLSRSRCSRRCSKRKDGAVQRANRDPGACPLRSFRILRPWGAQGVDIDGGVALARHVEITVAVGVATCGRW